ncbi:MAG TPA: aminotransferase class I/II-fold pyridoxal phosphate-dependent enzyme [Mycobacteriales bacterium]|nr:aminotransferase class I/II-fold pyridoxal phosphate-dependent enzyme [Mycobacteriales bacterium]
MGHPFDDLDLAALRTRRSAKWRKHPADVLPMWVAETDYPLADPIRDTLDRMVRAGDVGYAWFDGLAEAYCGFARQRYGAEVDPARVLGVQDVMRAVLVAIELLTQPGAGVVINPPVYPPFFSTIRYAGRRVVEAPMARDAATGRYELDLDALEDAFARGARCWLLCSPHNPTGRVFSRRELEAAAAVADRYGVTVLADEVHAPLVLGGGRFVPWATLSAESAARCVTVVSASKGWNLPGLKCALAIAGSPAIAEAFAGVPSEVPYGAGILGVAATEVAFRDGVGWLDDLLRYLEVVRADLERLLAERLPAIRWCPPEATYLAWLDCAALGLDDPATAFLERGRLAVRGGADFGTAGSEFVRLTFGTSRSIVAEAVERMRAAVGP